MAPAWGNQHFQKQGFLPDLEGQCLSPGPSGGGHSLGKGLIWRVWRGCLGLVCQVPGKGQKVVWEFAGT